MKKTGVRGEGLGAFPGLETVCIRGLYEKALLINWLAAKLPNLKNLELSLEQHAASAGSDPVDFSGWSKFEKLVIGGECQTSSFIQLLKNLPEVKELSIRAVPLDDAVAVSLAKCTELVELYIGEDYSNEHHQTSSFMIALANNISSTVTHLEVRVDVLNRDVGVALSKRKELRYLELDGKLESGFFASVLQAPLLGSLKRLRVQKGDNSQERSAEDNQAIAAAEMGEKGIKIRIY